MILSEKLARMRAEQPVTFAAFQALGRRGWIDLEDLVPAVEQLVAAFEELLCAPAGLDVSDVLDGGDVIGMAAFLSALRSVYPSVDETVLGMLATSRDALAAGRALRPDDFGPAVMERFDDLMTAATRAALEASHNLEPA